MWQCRAIWADVDRTDKPIAQPFLQNNARHSLNICDHILPWNCSQKSHSSCAGIDATPSSPPPLTIHASSAPNHQRRLPRRRPCHLFLRPAWSSQPQHDGFGGQHPRPYMDTLLSTCLIKEGRFWRTAWLLAQELEQINCYSVLFVIHCHWLLASTASWDIAEAATAQIRAGMRHGGAKRRWGHGHSSGDHRAETDGFTLLNLIYSYEIQHYQRD
jgi:hypothetical protein